MFEVDVPSGKYSRRNSQHEQSLLANSLDAGVPNTTQRKRGRLRMVVRLGQISTPFESTRMDFGEGKSSLQILSQDNFPALRFVHMRSFQGDCVAGVFEIAEEMSHGGNTDFGFWR